MSSYLKQAINNVDREADGFYDMAGIAKAVGGAIYGHNSRNQTASSLLEGSGNQYSEHYSHYKSWPYVAIRAITHRVAGQQVLMARRTAGTESQRARFIMSQKGNFDMRKLQSWETEALPSWVKHHMGFGGELITHHELLDAIRRPNAVMTQWSLMVCTVASIELTGRSFWYISRDDEGKICIWPLPSNWVTPIQGEGIFKEYVVTPQGSNNKFTLSSDEVAYFSLPDPANPMGSYSPVQAQIRAIETDEAIQQAQDITFKRGIFPGVVLRAGRLPGVGGQAGMRPVLTADQRKQLYNAVFSAYEGVAHYGEPMIVDGMIEGVEKFTSTPHEMDFQQSGKITKSRILQAFGVNPIVLGEVENANRAQAAVAEENFCNNVVNPLLELMSQVMTAYLAPIVEEGNDISIWIDPTHPHDREQKLKEWTEAAKIGAISVNEFRTKILNLPPMEGGDVALRPLNFQSVEVDTGETVSQSYRSAHPKKVKRAGMPASRKDIDLTVTAGMIEEAKKGLEWREEHGRGGTQVGVTRANQIIRDKKLSEQTWRRVKAYFDRHQVDKEGQGWSPDQEGFPSAGRIAWALWGGDAGWSRAKKIVAQLNARDDDKSYRLKQTPITRGDVWGMHQRQITRQHRAFEKEMELLLRKMYKSAADELTEQHYVLHEGLAAELFRPDEWIDELTGKAAKIVFHAFVEGAATELALFDSVVGDPRKSLDEDELDEILSDPRLDIPPEVLKNIRSEMVTIFEQPYWRNILRTTQLDIQGVINKAIKNGDSINAVERAIRDSLVGGRHPAVRANAMARTEMSAALNGGHQASMEYLESQGVVEGKEWLSVCGNTTRDPHCAISGEQVSVNEMFTVGAEQAPYPAHFSLSAENRVNCQCTILSVTIADKLNLGDGEGTPAEQPVPTEQPLPPTPPAPQPTPSPAPAPAVEPEPPVSPPPAQPQTPAPKPSQSTVGNRDVGLSFADRPEPQMGWKTDYSAIQKHEIHTQLKSDMAQVSSMIDGVHTDGRLRGVRIEPMAQSGGNLQGSYNQRFHGGYDHRISHKVAKQGAKQPKTTLTHEVGHMLDYDGIPMWRKVGGSADDTLMTFSEVIDNNGVHKIHQMSDPYKSNFGNFINMNTKAQKEFMKVYGIEPDPATLEKINKIKQAWNRSDAVKNLRKRKNMPSYQTANKAGEEVMVKVSKSHLKYLTQDDELWARAYTQYIAEKSDDATALAELLTEMTDSVADSVYTSQWRAGDFDEISEAIDELFEFLGWI